MLLKLHGKQTITVWLDTVRPPVMLSGLTSDGVRQGEIEVALQAVRVNLFGQAPRLVGSSADR